MRKLACIVFLIILGNDNVLFSKEPFAKILLTREDIHKLAFEVSFFQRRGSFLETSLFREMDTLVQNSWQYQEFRSEQIKYIGSPSMQDREEIDKLSQESQEKMLKLNEQFKAKKEELSERIKYSISRETSHMDSLLVTRMYAGIKLMIPTQELFDLYAEWQKNKDRLIEERDVKIDEILARQFEQR